MQIGEDTTKKSGAVQDAQLAIDFSEGRRARRGLLSPSLNPFAAPGDARYQSWRAGWQFEDWLFAVAANAKLKITLPCRYTKGAECPASCGGRGHCLDVA